MTALNIVELHLLMQDRIREAAETLRLLPYEDRRFLEAGSKCAWPQYVREWTAYGAENARSPRMPPTSAAIDRMGETIEWIAWLAIQSRDEAIIVWFSFGSRTRTGALARRLAISKQNVRHKRKAGVQRLVERFGMTLDKIAA